MTMYYPSGPYSHYFPSPHPLPTCQSLSHPSHRSHTIRHVPTYPISHPSTIYIRASYIYLSGFCPRIPCHDRARILQVYVYCITIDHQETDQCYSANYTVHLFHALVNTTMTMNLGFCWICAIPILGLEAANRNHD